MSWTLDAPTGTYKDNALSSKIRAEAAANSQFMRWLTPEPNFGRKKGETVNITRVAQIGLGGQVSEDDELPSYRAAVTTVATTVSEWGGKVELTEYEEDLTHFELRDYQRRMLRDQMRLTMDKMAADAMKTSVICAIGAAASTVTWDTDGTPSTAALVNIDVGHLREIHDYLHGDLKCPPMRNGQYVGLLSTKAARGLKNDSTYRDWQAPTTSVPFITGRLKSCEGFDLFETNHFDALDNTIGNTNTETGEAVFFGADAAYLAEVRSPELRIGESTDLGRFREIGWVGTLQAGIPWRTAATARIVRWCSS